MNNNSCVEEVYCFCLSDTSSVTCQWLSVQFEPDGGHRSGGGGVRDGYRLQHERGGQVRPKHRADDLPRHMGTPELIMHDVLIYTHHVLNLPILFYSINNNTY